MEEVKMRRADKAITVPEMEEILKKCLYGVLSTAGADGMPYGVPLSYVYEDGAVYFHCAKEVGHKLKNIGENNSVCFCTVGDVTTLADKFSTIFESVILFGEAVKLDGDEKTAGLMRLVKKYSPEFVPEGEKYAASAGEKTDVYKIVISRMSGKARRS